MIITAIELKEKLIAKINSTDDKELLDQISRLIDLEPDNDEIHIMSAGEIEAVNEGLEQMKNGQWITNEESNRRIKEVKKAFKGNSEKVPR